MYQTLNLTITGVSPMLHHSAALADPLNRFSREISRIAGKRGKTEADHEEIARLEFLGGLYLHGGQPVLTGEMLEGALVEAAKKRRLGNQARVGIFCDGMFPLQYDGPREPLALWAEERFRFRVPVRVQRNRVMRTRPIFRDWRADVEISFDPGILNERSVREIAEVAGQVAGLGDWRPRFGRFTVS